MTRSVHQPGIGKGNSPEQLDRIEEFFDRTAHHWDDRYAAPRVPIDFVLANRKDMTVEFIREQVKPGARVLDAGCGAGLTAFDLVRSGYFVHGVDIAQKMLDRCDRHLRDAGVPTDRYQLTRGNLGHPDLAAGSFAGIVALGFLQYQEEEHPALVRFHDLLQPNGVLVVTGPTNINLANYLGVTMFARKALTALRLLKPKPQGGRVGRHKYSVRRFRRLLAAAGFDVIASRGHGFVEFLFFGRLLGTKGGMIVHRVFTWLSGLLPIAHWGNDLVVFARKRSSG